MTNTSEKILQSIKESRLSPAPKWRFSVRNSVSWTMFTGAMLVGALSLSVIIELLVNHDWDIYGYLHKSFLGYIVLSLPYLWIMSVFIFSYLAYFYYVHTRGWYRHRVYRVITAGAFSSAVLGFIFFYLGFGGMIDNVLADRIPYYNVMNADKKKIWTHPEEGLLGGEVVKMSGSNDFVVKDYNGQEWDIERPASEKKEPAIEVGERVKIIGEEKNSGAFQAREIRRWGVQTKNEKSDEKKDSDEESRKQSGQKHEEDDSSEKED